MVSNSKKVRKVRKVRVKKTFSFGLFFSIKSLKLVKPFINNEIKELKRFFFYLTKKTTTRGELEEKVFS
jgi:hypothetical protein